VSPAAGYKARRNPSDMNQGLGMSEQPIGITG
jgi:hypothetical protein